METIKITLPTIDKVTFTVKCYSEDLQIKGNASSIDDETDKENEDYIISQLNNGNKWAWCRIEVIAEYKGIEGSDNLGGCSYASKGDFISQGGYYDDMKQVAYNNLIENIKTMED